MPFLLDGAPSGLRQNLRLFGSSTSRFMITLDTPGLKCMYQSFYTFFFHPLIFLHCHLFGISSGACAACRSVQNNDKQSNWQ